MAADAARSRAARSRQAGCERSGCQAGVDASVHRCAHSCSSRRAALALTTSRTVLSSSAGLSSNISVSSRNTGTWARGHVEGVARGHDLFVVGVADQEASLEDVAPVRAGAGVPGKALEQRGGVETGGERLELHLQVTPAGSTFGDPGLVGSHLRCPPVWPALSVLPDGTDRAGTRLAGGWRRVADGQAWTMAV